MEVDFGSASEMEVAFVKAHQQRFGFAPDTSDLIIDVLVVEAIGQTGEDVSLDDPSDTSLDETAVPVCIAGDWQEVPLVDRTRLAIGQSVEGPAILTEPTGTNVVEPGWRATCAKGGNLILERTVTLERAEAIGTQVDPVMLEVFNNLFMSIAEQMRATLSNTASSVHIQERLDFSFSIFAQNGDLVPNAPHVPVHFVSLSSRLPPFFPDTARKH